jgi:hypothetical protein
MSSKKSSSSNSKSLVAPATPPSGKVEFKIEKVVTTPCQTPRTGPDNVYDSFFYVQNSGTLVMRTVQGRDMELFNLELINVFNERSQLTAWGANAITFSTYFDRSVNGMDRHLFEISSDESKFDGATQFFKAFPPKSTFEEHLLSVFKLTTKDPSLKKKPLDVHAYPKAITWVPDTHFFEDGSPLPEPSTWPEVKVARSLELTDIYDMGDMAVEQPSKRPRK